RCTAVATEGDHGQAARGAARRHLIPDSGPRIPLLLVRPLLPDSRTGADVQELRLLDPAGSPGGRRELWGDGESGSEAGIYRPVRVRLQGGDHELSWDGPEPFL